MPPHGDWNDQAALGENQGASVMQLPERMENAITNGSTIRQDRTAWAKSRWLYYENPIRNYLKGLGCPAEELDDLVHDLLIRLQTYIILHYDPARPFRPYLKKAIRSFYFNYLKANKQGPPVAKVPVAHVEDPTELLNAGLVEYARKVYECFAATAEPRLQVSIKMLAEAVIYGARQEQLAANYGISERQIRSHMMRAADALATWMDARIHREDLEALAERAQRLGVKVNLHISTIRGLFSYLSREKRTRALLALTLIYQQNPSYASISVKPLLAEPDQHAEPREHVEPSEKAEPITNSESSHS
jgi:DNA-directed RNA polymerase specialized sigma24 family protein